MSFETRTAWDLIGFPDIVGQETNANVRIKGGRVLYEAVTFYDSTPGDNVKLTRLKATSHGIRQVDRYVDPDTLLEIIPDTETSS